MDSSLHHQEGQQQTSEDKTDTEYDDILTTTKFAGSENKEVKLGHELQPSVNDTIRPLSIRPLRLGTQHESLYENEPPVPTTEQDHPYVNKEVRHKATITSDDPVHEYSYIHLDDREVNTT